MSKLRGVVSPTEYEAKLNSPLERQKKMTAQLADRLCAELADRNSQDAYVLAFSFDSETEYRRAQLRVTKEYATAEKEAREMLKEINRQIYGARK